MTREAKIGMLTGLGVIVLIGVLLSEYLGGGVHPGAGAMSPTGRMAELPMGAAYRQEITQPVGVPGLAPSNGAVASGSAPSTPVLPAGAPSMPAPAFAAAATPGTPSMDNTANVPSGPTVNQPVAPVPAGDVQLDTPVTRSLPTMQLPVNQNTQAVYVAGETAPVGNSAASDANTSAAKPPALKVEGKEYVIASGDTLAKIAKKFYKSSKKSDIERIVAANPTVLKSEQSMLIAGRKLIIPTLTKPASDENARAPVASTTTVKKPSTIIHQPGSEGKAASKEPTAAEAKSSTAEPTKVYVVKSGDTLEKIARRLSPDNASEMVKKLMAANGIKDAKSLRVGMKLKVPSQAA